MTAHLEQWKVIRWSSNPYKAPEACNNRLEGIVTKHPNHQDGTSIITSKLEELDPNNHRARTHSREYTLGEPEKEWSEWCISQGYTVKDYKL